MKHGMVKRSATMSMLPALLLCAACTTVSADFPPPRRCSLYTDPFLEQTNHAPPPANSASKSWVNFGVGEAGQLTIANHDKANAKKVQHVCEDETQAAFDRAARRVKPWWKRIF